MDKISALIIDDSEEDRYLLTRQLKETGLVKTIIEKEDGKVALEFFTEHEISRQKYPDTFPPLLVFLDINMPILDGYGFLKEFSKIRNAIQAESSVILMFTSSEQEKETDERSALSYEFVKEYFVKGKFSSEELKEKIEQLV